jgi:hypothetical protein
LSGIFRRNKEENFKREIVIKPESRRNEFLSLLEEGLQDVSFTPEEIADMGN